MTPIGGAEEAAPGGEIQERFLTLAGAKHAHIAVIPTASEDAADSGDSCVRLFREMGAAEADWLRVRDREEANQEAAVDLLTAASGISLASGDQAGLGGLLVGTHVMA